jgi:ribosome biogenesis GTPase
VLEALRALNLEGVPVHPVNAKSAESLAVLHPYLGPGQSAVLVGSSGAGKSTLTNTLLGTEKMKTSAVRETDSRGRHTTTHRVLVPLPQGGCLIDTPGMRELKLSGDEDLGRRRLRGHRGARARLPLQRLRPQQRARLRGARGDRGGHATEERFAHYCKLRDERDAAAVTLAARRAEERVANKALNKRLKDKYGRR